MRVALVKDKTGRKCGLGVEWMASGQARPFLLTVEWTFEVRGGFSQIGARTRSPDTSPVPHIWRSGHVLISSQTSILLVYIKSILSGSRLWRCRIRSLCIRQVSHKDQCRCSLQAFSSVASISCPCCHASIASRTVPDAPTKTSIPNCSNIVTALGPSPPQSMI